MAREGHLVTGVEDPDPRLSALLRRKDERGLREADLERERLHEPHIELPCVGEHGELVAGERRVGEDIDDDVAQGRHRVTLPRCIEAHIVSSRAVGHRRF